MTDFLRLKIEFSSYRLIAGAEELFVSVGEHIVDAVTCKHGDYDWYQAVTAFYDQVTEAWWHMRDREDEGLLSLNHDSPDDYLAKIDRDEISKMGLVEVLTFLRKATAARPEIEDYNRNVVGGKERKDDPERDQRFIAACQKGLVIPALQRLRSLLEITPADIEAVLSLGPSFDSLTAKQLHSWDDWQPKRFTKHAGALQVPHPGSYPVVIQWINSVWCTPFYIDPDREVPGKEAGVPPPRFKGLGEPNRPTPEEFFAEADLDEVRHYMSFCVREEKWCGGYIVGEFERGVIHAAFSRLHELLMDFTNAVGYPKRMIGNLTNTKNAVVDPSKFPDEVFAYYSIPAYQETGEPLLEVGKNILSVKQQVSPGSVLFGKLNPRVLKVWHTADHSPLRAIATTEFLQMKPREGLSSRFLYFACMTNHVVESAQQRVSGSTPSRERVDPRGFYEIEIPFPTLAAQETIVQALESIQTARLARLKEIELERERKAALMAHLFAYGTKNEPRRDTPLGSLPENWEVKHVGEIAKVRGGKRLPKNHAFAMNPTQHAYLRVSDMIEGTVRLDNLKYVDEATHNSIKRYTIAEDDVYISIAGTIGLVGTIPAKLAGANLTENAAKLSAYNNSVLDFRYLAIVLGCEQQQRQIATLTVKNAQPKLALMRIEQILIPLPPIAEQRIFVEVFSLVDQLISSLESEAKLLDELFRATLEELMSGRLSVAPLLNEVVA